MQITYLKKVIENVAGPTAVKIVDLLHNKKDINEFLIAKKLDLTINQTRNLLYKLSHLGILSSTRKKDKRRGWYIYFWTFDTLKSLEVLEDSMAKEVAHLKNQLLSKKTKRFYKCSTCGREVNEETALIDNFSCPECGEIYGLADNTSMIKEATKSLERIEKELILVRVEIEKENQKKDKKLRGFLRRHEKKKKELRRRARIILKRKKTRLKNKEDKKKKKARNKRIRKSKKKKR